MTIWTKRLTIGNNKSEFGVSGERLYVMCVHGAFRFATRLASMEIALKHGGSPFGIARICPGPFVLGRNAPIPKAVIFSRMPSIEAFQAAKTAVLGVVVCLAAVIADGKAAMGLLKSLAAFSRAKGASGVKTPRARTGKSASAMITHKFAVSTFPRRISVTAMRLKKAITRTVVSTTFFDFDGDGLEVFSAIPAGALDWGSFRQAIAFVRTKLSFCGDVILKLFATVLADVGAMEHDKIPPIRDAPMILCVWGRSGMGTGLFGKADQAFSIPRTSIARKCEVVK